MQDNYLNQIAEKLEISNDEVITNSKRYNDINATYYYSKARGGKQVVVSDDGAYLMAGSSTNVDRIISEFKNGRRNGRFE